MLKYILIPIILLLTFVWLFFTCYQTEYHKRMWVEKWTMDNVRSFFLNWEEKAKNVFVDKMKDHLWILYEEHIQEWDDFFKYIIDLDPNNIDYYKRAMILFEPRNERYYNWTDKWKEESLVLLKEYQTKSLEKFCDTKRFEEITKIKSYQKLYDIWLKNPVCSDYIIPYYVWLEKNLYTKDIGWFIDMYRIAMASVNTDWKDNDKYYSLIKLLVMFEGKYEWYERWYNAYLEIFNLENEKDDSCRDFYSFLSKKWSILNDKLDGEKVKQINDYRYNILWKFDNNFDTCYEYLNRAVRMVNIYYLDEANNNYKEDNPEYIDLSTPKILLEKWYIDYIPLDFQQYEEHWIIYFYNTEIWKYDWKMDLIIE